MTKVILINGPARSGKDTLAKALYDNQFDKYGRRRNRPLYDVYKFAGVMQILWRNIFDPIVPDEEFYAWVDGNKKNEKHPFLGYSYRECMIDFSENYIKPRFGLDFFGKLTAEQIYRDSLMDENMVAVISDSGFKEEAVAIIEKFGAENILLVKLYREGYNFSGDSRGYINLDEFDVETVELENITMAQFERDGIKLVQDFVTRTEG